jgi:hypothetical protein
MIKIKTFEEYSTINEHFINWFPQDKKSDKMKIEYKEVLKDMLDSSYALIGGFMDGNYDIDKDVIDDCFLIKMYKKNGKVCAFRCYKDKFGRKAICSGTDGTKEGKEGLYDIFSSDIKFLRAWSEVDAKLEHIFCSKYGAERVPNTIAAKLLNKEITMHDDGYHYTRLIKDDLHTKCIITGSSDVLIKKLADMQKN